MKFWKFLLLFIAGGLTYVGIELLYRGWSHYSMFLAGGVGFLLIGHLNQVEPRLPVPLRALAGAGIITSIELLAGLLANRDYSVWDYRNMPLNFHGQICLPFSVAWIFVSLLAIYLYSALDKRLSRVFG